MDSLHFSAATLDHIEDLVRLRIAFLEEIGGTPAPPRLAVELRTYFGEKMPAGEFVAQLAFADGGIVATSGLALLRRPPGLSNLSGREGYIMNMYTLPPWRGRGIAGRLLNAVVVSARSAGCLRVSLHAEPLARPIYERAGFVSSAKEMTLDL